MHIATLTTYQSVREVVVSYLQAKQVWKPSAAYAGNAARKDPDAMDIGQIGHGKGKGKGKDGKGKEGKKGKGKDSKGKNKESHNNGQGGKANENKDRCAICWKTGHTTEKCWFNPFLQLINPGFLLRTPWRCQLLGFFIFLYLIFN